MKSLEFIKPSLTFLIGLALSATVIFVVLAVTAQLLKKDPPSLSKALLAKSTVELVPELYRTSDNKLALRYNAVVKEDKSALSESKIFKKSRNLKQYI